MPFFGCVLAGLFLVLIGRVKCGPAAGVTTPDRLVQQQYPIPPRGMGEVGCR